MSQTSYTIALKVHLLYLYGKGQILYTYVICGCCVSIKHDSFIPFLQIYIGNLRGKTAVRHNADMDKDLKCGSLVAVNHREWVESVPQIARVVEVKDSVSNVKVAWLEHDAGSSKKATWLRSFRQSKLPQTTIHTDNILLYNFELNPRGQTLRKTTREELSLLYDELRDGEWSYALQHSKRKRF